MPFQVAMSKRFNTLFAGLSEEEAVRLVQVDLSILENPGTKYHAATKLGANVANKSLELLLSIAEKPADNLYVRISKRRVTEALGRRKNPHALCLLYAALTCPDEQPVVNAADAITRIGASLTLRQRSQLMSALD